MGALDPPPLRPEFPHFHRITNISFAVAFFPLAEKRTDTGTPQSAPVILYALLAVDGSCGSSFIADGRVNQDVLGCCVYEAFRGKTRLSSLQQMKTVKREFEFLTDAAGRSLMYVLP